MSTFALLVRLDICSTYLRLALYPESPQEFSRQVTYAEGQQFATRMQSLFVEASAKTAVGVRDAFEEVVAKILDTPELWQPVTQQRPAGGAGRSGAGAGNQTMPGSVNLHDHQEEAAGGCMC